MPYQLSFRLDNVIGPLHEDLHAVLCAFGEKFAEYLSGSTLQRRIKRTFLHPVYIPEGLWFSVYGKRRNINIRHWSFEYTQIYTNIAGLFFVDCN